MSGECPAWVVPDLRLVVEANQMCISLARQVGSWHDRGHLAAVQWCGGFGPSPISDQQLAATRELARAECWSALCFAAGEVPDEYDFEMLGVPVPPSLASGQDYTHGVWRMLAWLLGDTVQVPVRLPERDADGTVPPWAQLYTVRPDPSSPRWRRGEEQRQERNVQQAREQYRPSGARLGLLTRPDPGKRS